MKNIKGLLVLSVVAFFLIYGEVHVQGAPVYNNETTTEYLSKLIQEEKDKGYVLVTGNQEIRRETFPITQLKREILSSNKTEPQFYLNYTDKFFLVDGNARKELNWGKSTYTLAEKLAFVNGDSKGKGVSGRSQMLFPYIGTLTNRDIKNNILDSDMYNTPFNYPQGFMYAETNNSGETTIKQFDYNKSMGSFNLLRNNNPNSDEYEAMQFIIIEKGANPDKILTIKATVDRLNRYVRVAGELFYFGDEEKQFSLLNQMAYDSGQKMGIGADGYSTFEIPPYYTYGKTLDGGIKGFVMKDFSTESNLIIRTDAVDGPKNWTISSYVNSFNRIKQPWLAYRGDETSDIANFYQDFTPNDITGVGIESDPEKMQPDVAITPSANYSMYKYDYYDGTGVVNSVKMKSDQYNLSKGQSIKLAYGFEPTTLYKKPQVEKMDDITKNETEVVNKTLIWDDQVSSSTGGTIDVYINSDKTPVQTLNYTKDGNVQGELPLTIEPKFFTAGTISEVKLVIKDSVYDNPQVTQSEHTSTMIFKVNNQRNIPIIYKSSKGKVLDPPEGLPSMVSLLDNQSANPIELPATMTEKEYPFQEIQPTGNSNLVLSGRKLTIKGNSSLKDGVFVIYKVMEVDAKVSLIENNSGKPILSDIKNNKFLDTINLTGLIPGENLADTMATYISDNTKLKLDGYIGYTRNAAISYKVFVAGKDVTETQKKVPDDDFEIKFYYTGEKEIIKLPDISFGEMNISNNSAQKYPLKTSANNTVEMYDTRNIEDTKVTVSLQGEIKSGDNVYGGQLHYTKGTDSDIQMTSNTPILVMETKKDKIYNSVSLNGSDSTKSGMYLVQDPGNYNGTYEGTLLWKIVPDTVTDAAK